MKHLTIPILEFVLAQPAHKLPVVFTPEKCPLPDYSDASEEVFKEVLKLQNEGLIESNTIRAVTGKPHQVQIRYITISGRDYLDNRNTNANHNTRIKRLLPWVVAAGFILVAATIGAIRHHRHEWSKEEAPIATFMPSASPLPSASPFASPASNSVLSPVAASVPSPTISPTKH
jgi:hypothetical protein